jgi:VWFA-related protein
MSKKATHIFLFALLAAEPVLAANKVTVEQLSREVASVGKKSDAKIAGRLNDLELTERLSAGKLAAFEAAMPGPESRRALVTLADQAEFLDPPQAEIPNQPVPGVAQQREIVAKSIDHVQTTLHQMPNLFANRDTIRFEDIPPGLRDESTDTMVPYQPLHPVSRSVETVLYQDGQELVQKQAAQPGGSSPVATGMITSGEFGPIFPVVYGDLPKGNLRWSHWEQGATGLESVFRFDVPKAASHYQVEFCCIRGHLIFQEFSAYHGELTIDPANGTILRMTLIADLEKGAQIAEADLMVEYGPIELGGKKYFCPVRSVSVSRAPGEFERTASERQRVLSMDQATSTNETGEGAPLQIMLNETTFNNYHLFRADAQILSAGNSAGGSTPNAPPDVSSQSLKSPSTTLTPQANDAPQTNAGESAAPAPPAESAAAVDGAAAGAGAAPPATQLSAASVAPSAASPATPAIAEGETPGPGSAETIAAPHATSQPFAALTTPTSSEPETAVVASTSLPETSAPSGKPGFSLKVNTRLVDVDVTAFDKKGQPVTSLTIEDFELLDNGREQAVKSFNRASVAAVPGAEVSPAEEQAIVYSNRPAVLGDAGTQPAQAQVLTSSTIFLVDESSVGFADLNFARQQILRFLDRLPESEPVGLYIRTGPAFLILAQETTDHAALTSMLRKWVPTAQDLARAQEEEARTRQSFDTVDSPSELEYVNGNVGGTNTPTSDPLSTLMTNPGGNTTSDSKVTKEGQNPQLDALSALIGVAANLNAIPGHKNLVWVASDNVLANWTDQAPGMERGPNTIGVSTPGVEEVLNDAHVSLYPLDVSQLEPVVADASLENRSVELNPAVSSEFPNAPGASSVNGGRQTAELQQDTHAVQPAIQNLARATGGQSFRRSSNMLGELNSVIADGDAAYLLSFSPDTQPDGKYHQITVTVPAQSGIKLRYRAGYLYAKEPTALKDRLAEAVWQPQDETEIGISAHWDHASQGSAISLNIATTDIGLLQKDGLWTDKLDIFLVERDDTGTHAQTKEQTLVLNLKPDTHQRIALEGIPFAEYIEHRQNFGTTRIIVVDENSGRIGSVTLPVMLERANQ